MEGSKTLFCTNMTTELSILTKFCCNCYLSSEMYCLVIFSLGLLTKPLSSPELYIFSDLNLFY